MTEMAALATGGCSLFQRSTDPGEPAALEPPPESVVRAVVEAHNARAARLERIYTRGVIELRWRDERGSHFEQGDIDLWIVRPDRVSLRVSKLSKVYLWMGATGDEVWILDRLDEPTVLLRRDRPDASSPDSFESEGALLIDPLRLLDLAGLTPVEHAVGVSRGPDDDADVVIVEADAPTGRVRLRFEDDGSWLASVEALGDDGRVLGSSVLMQPIRIETVEPFEWTWPRVPRVIDMVADRSLGDEGVGTGEIKFALGRPTTLVDDQPLGVVFDVERIARSLEPDVVEDRRAAATGSGATDSSATGSEPPDPAPTPGGP